MTNSHWNRTLQKEMKIHTCAWSAPSEPAAITEFGLIEDPLDLPLLRPLISLGLREPPCPPAPAPCAVPPLEADAAAAAFCCALLILLDARTCRWRLTAMAPWMACMALSHLITGYSFAFITRSIYRNSGGSNLTIEMHSLRNGIGML